MVYNFLVFLFFFNWFSFSKPTFEFFSEPSRKEALVYKQVDVHSKEQKKKRDLHCGAAGRTFVNNKIAGIVIEYFSEETALLPKARRMFVNVVEDLIKLVHKNEEIQPYLIEIPFSYKQAEIGLSFNIKKCEQDPKNLIYFVTLKRGFIYYRTIKDETGNLPLYLKESYEDALKIVQEEERQEQVTKK